MDAKRMDISIWSRWWLCVAFMLAALAGNAWADPVQLWVQPSGNTFANAYALQGESRDYFGRAECNACGALEFKWEFSDGTSTAFAGVGDPRYIGYAGKTFAAAGTQWARLTVREAANTANTATAQIDLQVIAAGGDSLNRQKNSAIDRGLRNLYQGESDLGDGSSNWGGTGHTGMALIAFENHGHNLQAPDSDLYKRTVRQGIQSLLNNAALVDINNQRCIGNPDTNGNGKGVDLGNGNIIYHPSIALLALVNSADQAFAQSYVAATSTALNGMTLFDIVVDATDWLAWAQSDGNGNNGGGSSVFCSAPEFGFSIYYSGSDITNAAGYFYSGDIASLGGCSGNFDFDWGDGSTSSYADSGTYCGYSGPNTAYPELNYATSTTVNHTYATGGNYTVAMSYTGASGTPTTALCSVDVPITVSGEVTSCGAADAQNGAGGWSYTPNEARGDNSLTQWAVLGLSEAKNRWGIDVNPKVIEQLGHWLAWSQCGDATAGTLNTFGYDGPGSWCNYQKAGAGLIMLKYAGKPESDPAVQGVLNYAMDNWNTFGGDWNMDNLYSMYGMYKAMKVMGRTDVGSTPTTGQGWEAQYDQNLINTQYGDGSWPNLGGWMYPSTAAAVAILAPEVASLPPVANAGGPYPTINAGQVLALNGGNSYHQDPAKHIVLWQWDFDASNGLWWDTLPAPPAGEGAVGLTPSVSYPDVGHDQAYAVTLRVIDDTAPTPLTDTDTATVNVASGNVAPVPVTNGPWSGLPNTDIVFDGSASYDPNDPAHCSGASCLGDSIVSYKWDLDGDGLFNEANGDDGVPVVAGDFKKVKKQYPAPTSLSAKLRVTDSNGVSATSTDSLNVISIAIVYGQAYESCYRVRLNRFQDLLGLRVLFQNQGTGAASNLVMTLTSAPSNLTIVDGVANLGNLAAGAQVTTLCDAAAQPADLVLRADRRIAPTGGWLWTADFDFNGSHYTVNNIPPLAP